MRRVLMRRVLKIVFPVVLIVGCIGPLAPDTGDLQNNACDNSDSNPDETVSFSRDILGGLFDRGSNRCLNCHDPAADTPTGVELGGLDLSSYETLRRGGVNSGEDIVQPARPCDSILYLKLTPSAPVGSRMPLGGPFLSEADITLLNDWIAEGADDN